MNTVGHNAVSGEHVAATAVLEPDTIMARQSTPHVEWVDVQGEVVVWNANTESLHLLDPIAAIIFQLLDGVTTLEQNARDLAEAFGRDLEQVRADVLAFAASLWDVGIVDVVK